MDILIANTLKTRLWATLGLLTVFLVGRSLQPPRHLRHIPHVSFLKYIVMAMIQKQPCANMFKGLALPVLSRSPAPPLYLKPGFLGWTVQVVTPEGAKAFFLKTDTYTKADLSPIKDTLIYKYTGARNILIATTKDEWKKHRKLVNPAFHKAKPLKTFGVNAHKVFQVLDATHEAPIEITALMERYALDVIGQAGFGFDFDSILHDNNDWVTVYNSIKAGLHNPVFLVFPWLESKSLLWLFPERQKKHRYITRFHAMLSEVIQQKRQQLQQQKDGEDDDKDLLTLMLESEFSDQETILTDEEIKSNLNVFFFAGHDTTANALAFAIHALARDPHLQEKARAETLAILGDAPHDVLPTLDQIKQMDYLGQVIKETLRFTGPVTAGTPRCVSHDTELLGYALPKGTPISASIYDLHHNPNVWTDPEVFDPERFAPGTKDPGMAWSPFYNGERMCIGMQFSLEEQRVMLSCLLRKYEWHMPKDSIHSQNVITTTVGIIRPKDLDIIFKRRY